MKVCSLCGNPIKENDQFCTSCGNPQDEASAESVAATAAVLEAATAQDAGFAEAGEAGETSFGSDAAVPIEQASSIGKTPAAGASAIEPQHVRVQPVPQMPPVAAAPQPSSEAEAVRQQSKQAQPIQPQPSVTAIPLPDLTTPVGQPPLFPLQPPVAPGVSAASQQPYAAPQPNAPRQGAVPPAPPVAPVQPASFAQEQPGASRPLYGGQAAYGQAQQNAYGTQNTYAPYGNGAVPPPVPPMPQGGMYQAPPMSSYYQDETVGLGEWLLNYLIMMVPFVNVVMLFVWGFGNSAKPSVRNWARASLIWMGIGLVLVVLFVVVVTVLANSMFSYGAFDYYGY